jgi:hypothetical protein
MGALQRTCNLPRPGRASEDETDRSALRKSNLLNEITAVEGDRAGSGAQTSNFRRHDTLIGMPDRQ